MSKTTWSVISATLFVFSGVSCTHLDKKTSVPAPSKTDKAQAQYNLGMLYLNGSQTITKDATIGRKWITKAAQNGYSDAQAQLGEMYITGQGATTNFDSEQAVNYQKARKWLLKAAQKENKKAYYLLGILYDDGKGVTHDATKAFEYYQKSADHGYAEAQERIAQMYVWGITPLTRDYNKAKEWYEKATAQGDQNAQVSLADMNRHGLGTPVDLDKTKSLYKKSCDQGIKAACYTYDAIKSSD